MAMASAITRLSAACMDGGISRDLCMHVLPVCRPEPHRYGKQASTALGVHAGDQVSFFSCLSNRRSWLGTSPLVSCHACLASARVAC